MRTKRLYARIYLHVLGVLFFVGIATSVVFSLGQRGAFMREVAARLARHLATELGERFSNGAERQVALARLHRDFELDLAVRDLDGHLLAEAGVSSPSLTPAELGLLRRGEDTFQKRQAVAVTPIRDARTGAVVGILQMSAPYHLHSMAQLNLLRPLMVVAFVLLLVALASFPLSRRISRPVELLTQASKRLGAGDLSYRIPLPDWCPRPGPGMGYGPPPWRHRGFHHPHHRFPHHHHRHRPDEVEELLYAWNDMADRIERLLNGQRELLANISHELRSPLTRVRVALALLPREGETDARLSEVEADLGELERLIEDVLTTSRLEAAGLPKNPGKLSLRPLLEQVAERARNTPAAADKAIAVEEGPELILNADATLLKRALFNLVENAAKYGAAPIVLAAKRDGAAVAISVSDQGEGIPVGERERVLEPFYRIDKARSPQDREGAPRGFGLGLTLARRVAEAHGGTIVIADASPNGARRGCRVTLRLPADVDVDGGEGKGRR